jgi:hypothetical protein
VGGVDDGEGVVEGFGGLVMGLNGGLDGGEVAEGVEDAGEGY